ncbi:MAG TPA: hypothetical protein RMF84_18505 [Polyangiaceae bacterium LLY-WYZ-14_1]|nr:hypothetical protein [Polyangiaceae bacterium LLY-WYZ-14_1]
MIVLRAGAEESVFQVAGQVLRKVSQTSRIGSDPLPLGNPFAVLPIRGMQNCDLLAVVDFIETPNDTSLRIRSIDLCRQLTSERVRVPGFVLPDIFASGECGIDCGFVSITEPRVLPAEVELGEVVVERQTQVSKGAAEPLALVAGVAETGGDRRVVEHLGRLGVAPGEEALRKLELIRP